MLRDEDVEGLWIEILVARARQLGAEEQGEKTADDEERHRRHQILRTDHLVIGVRPDVIPPGATAMHLHGFRSRRSSRVVVRPVVERADPDQQPERERDRRHHDQRHRTPDRVPMRGPANQTGEAEPEEPKQRCRPQRPQPAQAGPAMPAYAAGRACVAAVGSGSDGDWCFGDVSHLFVTSACVRCQILHERGQLRRRYRRAERWRHDPGLVSRRNVLVGRHDRLMDESGQRLVVGGR